jgi:hypothetical protein
MAAIKIPLKPQLILSYREVFGKEAPENRLDIIKGICVRSLIAEFAGLNYRLKPKARKFLDKSLQNQVSELQRFCGGYTELFKKYARAAEYYTKSKIDYPIIFSRQTCLLALEELIQSEMPIIEGFELNTQEKWDSILQYILAINSAVTEIEKGSKEEFVNFETLNSKMLPLNELSISTDPLNIPYRGFKLMEFLLSIDEFNGYVKDYFESTYNVTYDNFVYEILGMNFGNKQENDAFDFVYTPRADSTGIFDVLCQKFESKENQKLLSIRKYPFYYAQDNLYYLTDNTILLDKSYSQFINDFWFDYLKSLKNENGEDLYAFKYYKSFIGKFLEKHIKDLLSYSFENSKHHVVKMFDELEITRHGSPFEIADVYIRYNNKLIIGQAKATNIYDKEKYSGNMDALYKNDRNKFFSDFGLNQLVNSIRILDETIPAIDNRYSNFKNHRLYPTIFVDEKCLQTPLMAEVFQKRFEELLLENNVEGFKIHPLTIIHIGDLENIQDHMNEQPNTIWDLLEQHCSNKAFSLPFYYTILKMGIKVKYNKTKELFKPVFDKHNVN